jgi:hypothetical protein
MGPFVTPWAACPHRPPPRLDGVLLRSARAEDHADLSRLVELDCALPLAGPVLVAEEGGAIVAALCVSTGRAVADPFFPSVDHVELLRRYAARRHAGGAALGRRRLLPRLALGVR